MKSLLRFWADKAPLLLYFAAHGEWKLLRSEWNMTQEQWESAKTRSFEIDREATERLIAVLDRIEEEDRNRGS